MLILSRCCNEVIVIGTGESKVSVMVVGIERGRVKLGINAPREIPIFRQELLEQEPAKEKR